jgi:hypothetical protein
MVSVSEQQQQNGDEVTAIDSGHTEKWLTKTQKSHCVLNVQDWSGATFGKHCIIIIIIIIIIIFFSLHMGLHPVVVVLQ